MMKNSTNYLRPNSFGHLSKKAGAFLSFLAFANFSAVGAPTLEELNFTPNDNFLIEVDPLEEDNSCESWVTYLADIAGNGVTDIYNVSIEDGNAILSLIATSEIQVHIAFNADDNLIYAVAKADGSYRTLDPNVDSPLFGETQYLSETLAGIVTATFSPDGKLLVGSDNTHIIYSIEVSDNSVSIYDGYAPINGGDLAYDSEGMLYLATKTGSNLYQVYPDDVMDDQVIGNVPNSVTGMALSSSEQLLLSHNNASSLKVRNLDGSDPGIEYPLLLNGDGVSLNAGDMASGCSTFVDENEGDCAAFNTYYVQHGPGVSGTDLYSVMYSGSDAILSFLTNVTFEAHIAYDAEDEIVYLVNANGSFIRAYDPIAGIFLGDLPIDGNINSLYAAAFDEEDGSLIVGDDNDNEVYSVDLGTGLATFYGNAPVGGGDLVFQNGSLVLATRTGNKLYTVIEGGDAVEIGGIPNNVNGMARANNGTGLIMANFNATVFSEVDITDASLVGTYNAILDGESFTLKNGDMAAGCADDDGSESGCNYKLYYSHQPVGGAYNLVEVTLNGDGTASYVELMPNNGGHIALSPDGAFIYIVGGSNLKVYDVALGTIVSNVNIQTAGGENLSGFPAAVMNDEGTLFVGDGNGNQVYMVAMDGTATPYGPSINVSGGDLIFVNGELWIVTRGNDSFTNVLTGDSFSLPITEMNGAAVLENGNVLVADGTGANLLKEIDLETMSVVETYDIGLPLHNGDFAGKCISNDPIITEPGECYASEVLEYAQGTNSNNAALNPNRTDTDQALGAPERVDEMVFTTLGYGGSMTFAFGGPVMNGEGADIEVVEVSYNNPGCASYPEFADVSVSLDGFNWFYAGTVCKGEPFVDISDAGNFDYILYVRVSNNDYLTTSSDGFDLDGVVAVQNCDGLEGEGGNLNAVEATSANTLTSYPNPTTGPSQVVFVAAETGQTLVEVYDMNGRIVETLFNHVAEQGQEYRLDFNGAALPNGIYVYRMTTNNESIVDKFMVTK